MFTFDVIPCPTGSSYSRFSPQLLRDHNSSYCWYNWYLAQLYIYIAHHTISCNLCLLKDWGDQPDVSWAENRIWRLLELVILSWLNIRYALLLVKYHYITVPGNLMVTTKPTLQFHHLIICWLPSFAIGENLYCEVMRMNFFCHFMTKNNNLIARNIYDSWMTQLFFYWSTLPVITVDV